MTEEERIDALLEQFGEAYRAYHEYMCSETFKDLEAARWALMAELPAIRRPQGA
jgi:hypothetical protein